MAALPYMQFYVADYLADTMHLSTEEHGAYLLLIFNYWQTGKPLPKNRLAGIARVSNDRWTDVERSLNEFFIDDGNAWVHERIERDLLSVKGAQSQRSEAGKKSAQKRGLKKLEEKQNCFNERQTSVQRNASDRSTNRDTDIDKDLKQDQKHLPGAEKIQPLATGEHPEGEDTDLSANGQPNHAQPKTGVVPLRFAPPTTAEPVFISLPLNDGTEFDVIESFIDEMCGLYPAVDIHQELRNQRGWLLGEPKRRKTRRGIKKFITGWMSREQDRGPKTRFGGSNATRATAGVTAQQQVRAARNAERERQGLAPLGDDGGDLCEPLGEQERGTAFHDLGPNDFAVLE